MISSVPVVHFSLGGIYLLGMFLFLTLDFSSEPIFQLEWDIYIFSFARARYSIATFVHGMM